MATSDTSECFPPVVNAETRVLILGSLPGVASLKQQQYYAHPRNHFWPLMGLLTQTPLASLPYHERLQILLAHGIGLWDVVAQAKRQGSLDSDIREAIANPLSNVINTLPQLQLVAFNGKTAGKGAKQLPADFPFVILPSTSPAYTLSLAEKWQAWQQLSAALPPTTNLGL